MARILRRPRPLVLVAVVAAILAGSAAFDTGTAHAAGALSAHISAALARYHMGGPGTSVVVWDTSTGQLVYSLRPYARRIPASNEKLITSATALARWGADHRFVTRALASAPPSGEGVIPGDLYLRGGGDPLLSTSGLRDLAAAVWAAGVRRVAGRVVGDESLFDTARTGPGWRSGDSAYCGSLSALAVNRGWAGGQPAAAAARLFRQALVAKGVMVRGGAVSGRTPGDAVTIGEKQSAPLWRILAAMNKPSDNFIAEMLTKGLGRDFAGSGTTRAGVSVEAGFLRSCGLSSRDFSLRDGSGLSRLDRLSTWGISRLLMAMDDRLDFESYWNSLSVAGLDGTLSSRMRRTAAAGILRAKTGTLSVASALSGYVTTRGYEGLVFSIIMNGYPLQTGAARAAQDAIGVILAASDLP